MAGAEETFEGGCNGDDYDSFVRENKENYYDNGDDDDMEVVVQNGEVVNGVIGGVDIDGVDIDCYGDPPGDCTGIENGDKKDSPVSNLDGFLSRFGVDRLDDLLQDLDKQNDVYQHLKLKPLVVNDIWFVVERKWMDKFQKYIDPLNRVDNDPSCTVPHPGPMNNKGLLEVKSGLMGLRNQAFSLVEGELYKVRLNTQKREDLDFSFVHSDLWRVLTHIYAGGPPIGRNVVMGRSKEPIIELKLIDLICKRTKALGDQAHFSVSFSTKVRDIKRKACEKFGIDDSQCRLRNYEGLRLSYNYEDELDEPVVNTTIQDGDILILQEKDSGKWQRESDPETSSTSTFGASSTKRFSSGLGVGGSSHPSSYAHGYGSNSSSSYTSYGSSNNNVPPGTTGLMNLGNTCYMNSALQCLNNSLGLCNYFRSGSYKRDINRTNVMGMRGQLAEVYAELVRDCWSGKYRSIAPRDFKYNLERFSPMFSGYQQHDAQELLAFLLDGLHEDLNRVLTKPYKELSDPDNRPDKEVADEMWDYHKSRNDSIIVDLFQGQLKNTLVCPQCSRVAITFDPFMYLSLPLPMKKTRIIKVILMRLDCSMMRYACEVSKFGQISDLIAVLNQMADVSSKLLVSEIYQLRFYHHYSPNDPLDKIDDHDIIFAYEVSKGDDDDTQEIGDDCETKVLHLSVELKQKRMWCSDHFAVPFFVSILVQNNQTTYRELEASVLQTLSPFLSSHEENDEDDSDDTSQDETRFNANGAGHFSDEEFGQEAVSLSDDDDHQFSFDWDLDLSPPDDSNCPPYSSPGTTKKSFSLSKPLFTLEFSYPSSSYYSYSYSNPNPKLNPEKPDQPITLKKSATLLVHWHSESLSVLDTENFLHVEDHSSLSSEKKTESPGSITLDKCLKLFTVTEKLGPEDPWYCNKCKEHVQATKKFDLWRLPPLLVVHLKRFSYRNRYSREKLSINVDYPLDYLDLAPYLKNPSFESTLYKLYAVSIHQGGLGGGHYTAYAQNPAEEKWYQFDDSSVSPVSPNQAKSSCAYILFFKRKDFHFDGEETSNQ